MDMSALLTRKILGANPHSSPCCLLSEKQKLIIALRRSQAKAATLPSLPMLDGLSSENMSAAVTNLSDEAAYVRQNHINVSRLLYFYVPLLSPISSHD